MSDLVEGIIQLYPGMRLVPREAIAKAISRSQIVRFVSGNVLFEELQVCKAFPFVLKGEIRIFKRAENGREISLYSVAPGDACVVSAACLLGNRPYNACAVVQADCELVMMPAGDFDDLMSVKPFREYVFSLFSKRVVALMELIDEVAFRKLDQRLARFLLNSGTELELSHQELADQFGTVREMITRVLNAFSQQGLVVLSRGSIMITDRGALQRVADPVV